MDEIRIQTIARMARPPRVKFGAWDIVLQVVLFVMIFLSAIPSAYDTYWTMPYMNGIGMFSSQLGSVGMAVIFGSALVIAALLFLIWRMLMGYVYQGLYRSLFSLGSEYDGLRVYRTGGIVFAVYAALCVALGWWMIVMPWAYTVAMPILSTAFAVGAVAAMYLCLSHGLDKDLRVLVFAAMIYPAVGFLILA